MQVLHKALHKNLIIKNQMKPNVYFIDRSSNFKDLYTFQVK